jgi:hypothetical protein
MNIGMKLLAEEPLRRLLHQSSKRVQVGGSGSGGDRAEEKKADLNTQRR